MKKNILNNKLVILTTIISFFLLILTLTPSVIAPGNDFDFKQYATLDDQWIGSILQHTNSVYYEGMSVPQRLVIANIQSTPGNSHYLTFSHEYTKGGLHAYDFLVAWNQGNEGDLSLNYDECGENWGPKASETLCQLFI